MKWLVTGAGGLLGHALLDRLASQGVPAVGLGRALLDITEPRAVRAVISGHRPDVVVNCAAYTAIEAAESQEAEAMRINGTGPRLLAAACAEHGARLIHVSTDYVFSGDARTPYPEDHPTGPCTAYGRTKLAGERAVLDGPSQRNAVVRTAWLYGAHGRSFVRSMAERASQGDTADVVDDQRGQPTWAADAAEQIVLIGSLPDVTGIFHATNSGDATWYELAREVYRLLGADLGLLRPITSEAFAGAAPRPAYTVLGHGGWREIGTSPLRDWRDALRAYFHSAYKTRG
jgi:dTDP-4-dehydrorhamnose reductase